MKLNKLFLISILAASSNYRFTSGAQLEVKKTSNLRSLHIAPVCPEDGEKATCCDEDRSCIDGDDDWCCGEEFYCSNDGEEYAKENGGILCPPADDDGTDDNHLHDHTYSYTAIPRYTVFCPGKEPGEYCDCTGDCTNYPSYCDCDAAQLCCDIAPVCPEDGEKATCCDIDRSCMDGDDDWCCGEDFYCSNDGEEYAKENGGILCPHDADDGEDDAAEMPAAAVVAQGIASMVNNIIDSNYGTPPPTPTPTVMEDNAVDDVVNKITDQVSSIAESISSALNP